MNRAITQFDEGFLRISNIEAVYTHLVDTLKLSASDLEDILRSEIVYAVSALDRLIHDLVKIGMVEIFTGLRSPTSTYLKFQLSLNQYKNIYTPGILPPEALFEQIIIESNSYITFQDPSKIKEGLNYIWAEDYKWQKIAICMAMPEDDVKVKLKNIVIRRNQIAHEMDLDLSTGLIQHISHADTISSTTFIKLLGHCIYDLVK